MPSTRTPWTIRKPIPDPGPLLKPGPSSRTSPSWSIPAKRGTETYIAATSKRGIHPRINTIPERISEMKKTLVILGATMVLALGTIALIAQQREGQRGGGPPPPMSFFITSVGKGDGANYGGLAGADAYCQMMAAAAGRGAATWHAYLSTQGTGAVNARDRIGSGPWFNAGGTRVAQNVGELHGDTIEQARLGNVLGKMFARTEKNGIVNGVGDTPNQHDIITGSQADGRAYTDAADHTCGNYTKNSDGTGSAQLGHSDKQGGGNSSWNSAHPSRGCSQPNLVATGGAGLF